jgi:hypothetical protein
MNIASCLLSISVNEHYYDTDYVSVDRSLYVWVWDIMQGTLHHGSRQIARYPVYPLGKSDSDATPPIEHVV